MKNFLIKLILPLVFFIGLFLCGCGNSYIKFSNQGLVADINGPNTPWSSGYIEAKGEAATTLAKQFADNIKTKEGLIADVFKRNGELFAGLIITTVGGLIFWGFTRSKYGWIIPAACMGGIATILFFVNYTKWVSFGVLAIVLGLLIWKAIEYQKERNKLIKEKT